MNLSLIHRYYDHKDLPIRIDHHKIKLKRKIVPSPENVKQFFDIVEETLSKNSNALIGVHCRTGLHMTGMLISVRLWNFKDGGSFKASFLAKNQHGTKEKSLRKSYE